MIIKFIDRFPGGRLILPAIPFIGLIVGFMTLPPGQVSQVCSLVSLCICAGSIFTWRRGVNLYLQETEDVGTILINLGMFIIVATTVLNVGYSFVWRVFMGMTVDYANSYFLSFTRFSYTIGFSCLYLAPLSRQTEIPWRGWLSLFVIITIAVIAALFFLS